MWNGCRMFGHACTQNQVSCHRLKLKGLEAKHSSSQNTQRLIKFQKSFVTVVRWSQTDTVAQRLLNRKLQYSSWVLLPCISSYRWRGDDVWKELLIDGNRRSKQSWNWSTMAVMDAKYSDLISRRCLSPDCFVSIFFGNKRFRCFYC